MKSLILLCAVSLTLAGCGIFCPTAPQTVAKDSVEYIPPTITSKTLDSLGYVTSDDCAQQVADAFVWAGNYASHTIDSAGNVWNHTLKTKIDSIGKSKTGKIVYLTRKDSSSVKPSPVMIPYSYPQTVEMSLAQRIKLACFWPLVILLFGTVGLVAFYQLVLQNPSKAVSTVDDIIHRI